MELEEVLWRETEGFTRVLEPRMHLRRARLKKGVKAGRLQSTKAVWDSQSGLSAQAVMQEGKLLMGSRARARFGH